MTQFEPIPHRHPIDIVTDDIDFMGHVNNARYLQWVQAAVIGHWRRIAPPDAVASYLWVALKHEITYRKPAFAQDSVFATTLLKKYHGVRAFYDTVIRRGEDVLAEVHSVWCSVDAQTLRPVRLPQRVMACFHAG